MSTPPKIQKVSALMKRDVPSDLPQPPSPTCETAWSLADLEREIARRKSDLVEASELQLKIMARARG